MSGTPNYRIDASTTWKPLPPGTVMGCCRCSRPAEYTRVKYRNRKGAQSYDIAGFCAKHADRSVVQSVNRTVAVATVSQEDA